MIGHILKNKQKNMYVRIPDVIGLTILKMKMEMQNRSHRYNINRPMSRHGHKYSKYKKCLSMMMLLCIKQHLSNIWSSIHEKVKQHWGWVENKRLLYYVGQVTEIWDASDKPIAQELIFYNGDSDL